MYLASRSLHTTTYEAIATEATLPYNAERDIALTRRLESTCIPKPPFHHHQQSNISTYQPTTTMASTLPQNNAAPKSLFPDGLKTSGQHNPIYSQLTPPSKFPKEISGPTVWKAEDYRDNPERWTHVFSEEEIAELGGAADEFIESGRTLTAMAKVGCFPVFLKMGLDGS